jgi:hypothetical protein
MGSVATAALVRQPASGATRSSMGSVATAALAPQPPRQYSVRVATVAAVTRCIWTICWRLLDAIQASPPRLAQNARHIFYAPLRRREKEATTTKQRLPGS